MTGYTGFYQHLYRPRVPLLWWLRRRSYLIFVLRELSSVSVAWFVGYTLLLVHAVATGPQAYREFLAWSARPWALAVNVVALLFVTFHAVTWFNLAPSAMVVRIRGTRVPRSWIVGAHYAGWALLSALVAWLIVG